jgi:hypothetical protein
MEDEMAVASFQEQFEGSLAAAEELMISDK